MKFLLIDDDPTGRSLTINTLSTQFPDTEVLEVNGSQEFEQFLNQADFDLVISEYWLHWTDGLKLFKKIRDRYACIPFIILSDSGNEEIAVKAIKAGVDDYLPKKNRHDLSNAVSKCLTNIHNKNLCHSADQNAILCEKWDLAISRLTSDFAYSMRIPDDGIPVFEWFTEPLKSFINTPKTFKNLPVHLDDSNIIQRHLDKLLMGFEDTAEYRVISRDGNVHYFSDHALPIRDWKEGKVVRIYGAIQDITHHRKAEEKLHLMQRAMDSSNNGIMITGPQEYDHPIIYVNKAFVRISGYTQDELLGRNPRFLQRDDNKQPGIEKLRQGLDKHDDTHVIIRNYRKDGSLFWNELYISPVYDKHHKVTHFIGVQNDVSQRIEMDQLILYKEAKMRAIFNNVTDAIIIADNNNFIESFNPSAAAMFGYSPKELQGMPVEQLISIDKSRRKKFIADQITTPQTEAYGVKNDGATFPIKVGISLSNLKQHSLLILTIQNISDSKQAEDTLRKLSSHLELAREEERSRIAREIHDELGSKLTALKMDLSWLADKLPANTRPFQYKTSAMHQHIDDAIRTVKKIATDLRPSILDHLGLSAAIEWQIENFRKQTGLDCSLKMPTRPVEIDGQRATAVFRIIQESLTNISRHAHAGRVNVEIYSHKNQLSVSINDDGCGMTVLQMNNPDKFGIRGMHERALHFNGELTITNKPGKGCTVTLTLPQHPKED